MRIVALLLTLCHALIGLAQAEVAPAEARVPNAKAWVGQRVPFFVDLRSKGSFSGTASFDLPQISGALVIKIGDPVVDTQKFDGEEWFVQKHEFALFSQNAGEVEIPAFPVRFSRRDGFSGPVSEVKAQSTILALAIERPPGSEQIGFLVTTDSLAITETWDPKPGPTKIGAMFKRTVTQRAEQLPGMALAPVPTEEPDGIRIYPGPVETKDNLYRGAFIGERSETITYLLQKSGTLAVPALTYVWWNPKTQALESKTLPAVTFEVAAPPPSEKAVAPRRLWPWLLAALLMVGLILWQRRHLAAWLDQCQQKLNPPDRVAAQQLLRACRANDAEAAYRATMAWKQAADCQEMKNGYQTLQDECEELSTRLFSAEPPPEPWSGEKLARAFTLARRLHSKSSRSPHRTAKLPALNPQP